MKTITIEVLNTSRQSASLTSGYSTDKKSKVDVLNYNLIGMNGPINWHINNEEAYEIIRDRSVVVNSKSKFSGLGVFDIGRHHNWLYSHSLFPTTEALEEEIYRLLNFSLTGKEVYDATEKLEQPATL